MSLGRDLRAEREKTDQKLEAVLSSGQMDELNEMRKEAREETKARWKSADHRKLPLFQALPVTSLR